MDNKIVNAAIADLKKVIESGSGLLNFKLFRKQ
jgi:hypothetical protein